jgi:2-polyprenyl-3-methyl-5-hydroxy-6-metoxy-1,4-benzoquinol methylase
MSINLHLWNPKRAVISANRRLPTANSIHAKIEYKRAVIYESVNIPLWRALKASRGLSFLDVGCGTGALGELLTQNGNIVHGITYSNDEAAIAKDRIGSVRVMDLNDLKAVEGIEGAYDALLFADVLEHLLDPAGTLNALLPRLKLDGRVYVSLPNIACFYARIGLLFGRFNMSKTGGILDETHLHFYTLKTAREFLMSAGLKIVREDFMPAPSVWTYQTFFKKNDSPTSQAPQKMAARGSFQFYEKRVYPVEHFFTSIWRSLLANQFVFVCARKP